jgi:hypothetical protein
MTTVGFNFTKILVEKKNVSEQNIKIENNVGITNVQEVNVFENKKSLIRFQFGFTCRYEPGLGSIELQGELIEFYDKEVAAKLVEGWKANKKITPEIMPVVLNNILNRSNIEAILLSREVGLPSPIALPKVELKMKPDAKSEESKTEKKEDSKKKK